MSQLPFVFVVKLFPILADSALTVLIVKIALNAGEVFASAFGLPLLCALSPIAILVLDYARKMGDGSSLSVRLSSVDSAGSAGVSGSRGG